jgi:hypothetical protein
MKRSLLTYTILYVVLVACTVYMITDGTRIAAAVACGAHISCVAGQDGARGGIRLANMRVLNLLQQQPQSQVPAACYIHMICQVHKQY